MMRTPTPQAAHPHQQLLRITLREIQSLRESNNRWLIDDHAGRCHGIIYAGLITGAFSESDYDRLSELTISATYYRRLEQEQPPYTWLVAPDKKVAA